MKRSFFEAGRFLALGLFLIFAIGPLYWIIVTSLKDPTEIYTFPIRYLPSSPSLESYRKLFGFAEFGRYFGNSLMVTILVDHAGNNVMNNALAYHSVCAHQSP